MRFRSAALLLLIALAGAGHAQLVPSLPSLPPSLPTVPAVEALTDRVSQVSDGAARRLEETRRAAAARLVREHPDRIALDPAGFPARAGEIVVDAPTDALIAAAAKRGYTVIERDDVLGVAFARLGVPSGRSLSAAIKELKKLGGRDTSADQLHFASGGAVAPPAAMGVAAAAGPTVGVIDGAVAGASLSRPFAQGPSRASGHATAIASLVTGRGVVKGALPGAQIASADVYGSDPAGGSATAIARALGWLVSERVPVAVVSLVGPANPVLGRIVAAVQARGLVIVAAIGNDGPASPLAYPASYPGVVAVTGVDAKNRALIEAGRASHIDYAAPGAGILAGDPAARVRGTSYAAPLVAGTIARFYPALAPESVRGALNRVDATARDLGARGPDKVYGRGLVCGACPTFAP